MSYAETGFMTILVIDDDAELRQLIGTMLRGDGHLVIDAGSAEAGLEQLPFYVFDVAFLDHHLPGMEGLVLGEYLRANNPNMQIALVTGGADAAIERGTEAHDITLVHKPFELDVLLDIVAAAKDREDARIATARATVQPDFELDLSTHHADLCTYFGLPNVPNRLEDAITRKIQSALAALRFGTRFDERDRAAAYAGLIAADVLGIKLPRDRDGRSLHDQYDALMTGVGKATAFGDGSAGDDD